MHYIEDSVLCSVLAVTIGRLALRRSGSTLPPVAVGLLAGALAAAIHAGASGQFANVEGLVIAFGLATGLALGAAAYLTARAVEDLSLAASPSTLRVGMLVPLALGLTAFGAVESATARDGGGMLLGAIGLALAAIGSRQEKAEMTSGARIGATIITLAAWALAFTGIVLFDAVVISRGSVSLFLLIAFGVAGAVALVGVVARKQRFAAFPALLGAVAGALLFGAYSFLLLAFGDAPLWRVIGVAASAHAFVAAVLAMLFFRERYGFVGYLGLVAAAAGAAIIYAR